MPPNSFDFEPSEGYAHLVFKSWYQGNPSRFLTHPSADAAGAKLCQNDFVSIRFDRIIHYHTAGRPFNPGLRLHNTPSKFQLEQKEKVVGRSGKSLGGDRHHPIGTAPKER
jgi:hypothetical protein